MRQKIVALSLIGNAPLLSWSYCNSPLAYVILWLLPVHTSPQNRSQKSPQNRSQNKFVVSRQERFLNLKGFNFNPSTCFRPRAQNGCSARFPRITANHIAHFQQMLDEVAQMRKLLNMIFLKSESISCEHSFKNSNGPFFVYDVIGELQNKARIRLLKTFECKILVLCTRWIINENKSTNCAVCKVINLKTSTDCKAAFSSCNAC